MPTPVAAQISKLRQLKPGWYRPDTPVPAHPGLDWFQRQYEVHYTADAPLPALFPTPEGNISVEWRVGDWAADMEVDLHNHHGLWGASNLHTQQGEERTLDLDNLADWTWLSRRLAQLQTNQR